MSNNGKVAPSRSDGPKGFSEIVGSPTSLTEFGPLTPDEKPQGYGFSISNFFKKAVRGNSPSRKPRSGTNSSSSSGAWQDNQEGAENTLSNAHMISTLHSTTLPEDGPGWLEKSHQDSIDEGSKLSAAPSMTSLISKLGPAVVSKQDADKHDRNLPNVLIRIKNIIDKRGTTPQQYKDSDFKQYWLPDSVSRECYECEEKFTTFRRRHHCRVCGQIFCSRCCNRMIPGKIIGYTGELRVCTYCCKVVLSYLQSSNLSADVAADLWALGDPLTSPALQTTSSMLDITTSTQGSSPTSTQRGTLKRRPSLGFQEEKYARTRFPSEEYTGLSSQRDSEQMTAERQLLLHDSQQLHSLWQQLLGGPGGLPLGTHRHRLKSFHNCFIGRDLMNWLLTKDKASNRSSAVAIGQALLEAGYLVCISQPEQVFVADYVLYRPSSTGSSTQEAATAHQGSLATQDSNSQEPLWVKQILHPAEGTAGVDASTDKKPGISEDWSSTAESSSSMTTSNSNYYLDINIQEKSVSIKKPNTPSGVQDVLNHSDSVSSNSLQSSSYATTVSAALSASAQLSQSYQSKEHIGINTHAINDEVMQALRDHDVQANTAGETSWQPKDSSALGNEDRIMRQRLECMWSSHENALLCQLLDSAGLSSSWAEVILPFVHTITDIIRPDVKNDSDDMDIRQYIQFKKVPGGSRSECEIVNGAVCTKNVADKSMAVRLTDPQILLIATTIDYQRGVDSKLLALDNLLLQEAEYLKNVVQKISSYHPDIILVEKSIAFLAREALQREGITLVMNVKPSVMERVARCTQASMMSSIDAQLGRPTLGMCHNFYLRSYSVPGRSKPKTLMLFDGCATHLGCTVILRGATNAELKRVKRIMYFMIYAVYNWRLERSFLLEEFTSIPPLPSESFELEDQVFEEHKPDDSKEQVNSNKKNTEKDTSANGTIGVIDTSSEEKVERKHENITRMLSDEILQQETANRMETDLRSELASNENEIKKNEESTNNLENQKEEENIKDNIDESENVFLDNENQPIKQVEAEPCRVTLNSVAIQDALKKNEEEMCDSSYCVDLSGNDQTITVMGIDKTKVGQTVSDFSDPLHSYLNSGTSPQESVQSTLPFSEAPYMNSFRKTLDETILSCSPYVKYSVPYLEGEVGRKCNLRRFFNKCLYFSLLLENEKVIRRPRFSEKEEIKDENENVEIKCPHKFTNAKITSDAHELDFRNGLADFRARGGQYRNVCHCEKTNADVAGKRRFQTSENQVMVEGLGSTVEQVFSADSTGIGSKAHQSGVGSTFSSEAGGLILASDGRVDALHAFNHQRLSVLFSSYSQSSHAPPAFCVSPWVLTMDFYGRNDIPLGAFLERYCFSTKYKCPNADCSVAIVDHVRKFVHEDGCVEVLLRKLDTKLDDTNNAQILMWSCCKICRQVTPVVPMSLESWSLSFAKYLELRFHGGTFTRRGTTDCTHSLHHDHFQYFGYNNQVAIFKFAHVSLREIALPPPTMNLKVKPVTQSSIVELIKTVAVLGYSVFYTILERISSLSAECGPRWDPLISGIEDHHNQERANFREMIESIQLQLTSPTLEARRMYPPSPGVTQELSTTMLNIADQVILIKRLITKVVADWNAKVADLVQLSKKEDKIEKTYKASSNSSPLGRQSTSNSLSASLAQISNDVSGVVNKQIGDTSSMASSAALTGLSCESLNLTPSQSEHYITENPNRSTDEDGEVEFGSNKNINSEENHQESSGTMDMTGKTQQEESHESSVGGNVIWKCLREELASILHGLQHLNTVPTSSNLSNGINTTTAIDLTSITTSPTTSTSTTQPSSSTMPTANTCTTNTTSVLLPPTTTAVADTAPTPHNAVDKSAPSVSSSSSDMLVMTSWENVSDVGVGLQAVLPQLSDPYTVLHRRQASDTGEALAGNVMEDYSLKCHERSLSDGGGPIAVGRDTVDKGIPRNASNTVKSIISTFWSSSANLMVESPFSANEHYLLLSELRIPVVVYGDEPSSIIAHALASTEYDKQLQSLRKRIKDSIKDVTALRSTEKGSTCSLDKHGDESDPEEADFSFSLSDSEKSKFTKDPHIELQWNDIHAKFYCKIFFPEHFRQLRKMVFPFGEELYIRSLAHCVPWEARGGKSGSVFCKSHDDRFVLKEMSRYEMNTFLKFGPSYVQYMKNAEKEHQPTVLTRIVGVYSIGYKNTTTNKATRLDLLVMENLFYQRNITHKFDLKGSVRNRLVNISGKEESELVLLDENLLRMACSSPLYVRPHSKTVLSRAIAADTVFLSKQLIIDYSLLVGIDDDTNELVIGIIDYIRTFTWDKKLETIIKGNILGTGTGKLPTVVSPELYRTRFCHAMDRYFLLSPDRWMGMGVGVEHVN